MDIANDIVNAAADLSNVTNAVYDMLAPVVADMLLAQMPKSICAEEHRRTIVIAGACMVLSFARAFDDNELASFDAGTLKLDFRQREDRFAQIAKQIMAPLCHDAAFLGVRA